MLRLDRFMTAVKLTESETADETEEMAEEPGD